jgi:hypothetical protein
VNRTGGDPVGGVFLSTHAAYIVDREELLSH